MRIARLKTPIEIQASVLGTANEFGDVPRTWSTVHHCRAEVEPVTDGIDIQPERLDSRARYKVKIRKVKWLTRKHRILRRTDDGEQVLEIDSIVALYGGDMYQQLVALESPQ